MCDKEFKKRRVYLNPFSSKPKSNVLGLYRV